MSNVKEVKARSGIVIAVAIEGDEEIKESVDHVLYVPKRRSCCCRFWKWSLCNCWPITLPYVEDVMWTSRATWLNPSRWNKKTRNRNPAGGT